MRGRMQIRHCKNSTTYPLITSQSKLLNKNRKPLMPQPLMIQTKLAINQSGDNYEQEADRTAEQVMRMPIDVAEEEQKVDTLQRKHGKATPTRGIITDLEEQLDPIQSDGKALPDPVRLSFDSLFGYDLSHVRVHADHKAASFNHSLNARAFTVSQDMFLREGEINAGGLVGQRLLLNEPTHILQQRKTDLDQRSQESKYKLSGQLMRKRRDPFPLFQSPSAALPTFPVVQAKFNIGEPNDKLEQEADRMADFVMRMPEAVLSDTTCGTSASVYPSSAIQPHGIECEHSGVDHSTETGNPVRMRETIKLSPVGQADRQLARKPQKEEESKT